MLAGNSIIEKAINEDKWTAHRDGVKIGFQALKVGPHSIDVSLSGKFLIPTARHYLGDLLIIREQAPGPVLDPYHNNQTAVSYVQHTAEFYDLKPGEFILGCVRERFDCGAPVSFTNTDPDKIERCTQHYDGRSTMGRLGIISHATAGYGDLGFASNFTLEICNLNPNFTVRLHRGMRIGQVSFHAVANTGRVVEYEGNYTQQHDIPVAPSLGAGRFLQPGEGFDPASIYQA